MAAFLIVCGAHLVIDSLVGGGIADPTLLVMHSGAVLLVASLVHMLALRLIPWLALGFYLTFKGSVVDSLTLPVAHLATPFLKECFKDCAVDSVVGCPTFRASMTIVTTCHTDY